MTVQTDADLFRRGADTLVASWEEYARGAVGAFVQRVPGVAIAVFPNQPERAVYNNALLARDLPLAKRAEAIDAMDAAYAGAGVTRFAAWVHERDEAMCRDLEQRGYAVDTSTRAMAMSLDDIRLPRPDVELAPPDWTEHLRFAGVPPTFLRGADPDAYHILIGRCDGENVATAMAFDHGDDCGIYNTGTLEHARRRGLATALTALHVHDALLRGCRTASLQSTEMAEHVYAAVGFRDLGRILEYAPPQRPQPSPTIRDATRHDVATVVELWREFEAEVPEPGRRGDEAEARQRELEHAIGTDIVLLAEHDGRPVGLAVADSKSARVGCLHILYVRPSSRQSGVAAALVLATVDRLRARGHDTLELEVLASNERARSVYERWGFAPAEITLAATIDALVERLRS